MKTQKTLILAGLAMSLVVASGCKNSSIDAAERVKGSPEPSFVANDLLVDEAMSMKEKSKAANKALRNSRKALKEAEEFRDKIVAAREAEGNSIVKEILSTEVEGSIKEVQALQENVTMARKLVIAERKNFNTALEKLSDADKQRVGLAEESFSMGHNEKVSRIEMSLDAEKEMVKKTEEKIQKLNARLIYAQDQMVMLEEAGTTIVPASVIMYEKEQLANLENDLEEANKDLAVHMANEENLAKLLSEMVK